MEDGFYGLLHSIQEKHWWYEARRKIFRDVFSDLKKEGLPSGILYDLGCGVGANLPVLEEFGSTLGVDSSATAVEFCHKRGRTNIQLDDIGKLDGLPEGSGAAVLLADVIEHLDDDVGCLKAARKLLAPGGALVVSVPAYQFLWGMNDERSHHKRRYTMGQIRRLVSDMFTIEKLTYFNTFLFPPFAAGRLAARLFGVEGGDETEVPPKFLNDVLERIFAAERPLLRHLTLPFGVSILCVARK